MKALGLIFADSYDDYLHEMTRRRTLAAVPFGGRYRIIDFLLSNLVNSGVRNMGVFTTRKYFSLMNHVRAGESWDLDRKQSSLIFLPPFASRNEYGDNSNRLEAIQHNLEFVKSKTEPYVIMCGSSNVGNIDFEKMLQAHIESGAKLTGIYTKDPASRKKGCMLTTFKIGENGFISDCKVTDDIQDGYYVSANIYIMNREDLVTIAEQTMREGQMNFRRDLLQVVVKNGEAYGYEAPERLLFMFDTQSYLQNSLELLKRDVRSELFKNEKRPIITSVKDSPPARYGKKAEVTNSFVADGTVIDGTVRNSIIFRGARIMKGAVVENSVVMQDCVIRENAYLNYAIMDKNACINEGRVLSGYVTHPFYIETWTTI